jgi:PAS domain S-box-containing protein
MKKSIIIAALIVFVMAILTYSTNNANKKIENFFVLHKHIANINAINKDLDIFMSSSKNYNNFDLIQRQIRSISQEVQAIEKNEIFSQLHHVQLKKRFIFIKQSLAHKVQLINKIASSSAVLNNSYRYIQKLNKQRYNPEVLEIYSSLLELGLNPDIHIEELLLKINQFQTKNNQESLFFSHARIVVQYHKIFNNLKKEVAALHLQEGINAFEKEFTSYSQSVMSDLKNIIWLLIFLLFIAALIFLYNMYLITRKQLELKRFKQAVQQSDNIVVITNKDHVIKYVNKSFETITGYTKEEVIGQKPSMLKSNRLPKSFYTNLKQTIAHGKKWQGEFINKNKQGKLSYEKASITPIFNEKGEIEEFLAIKLDVTKERETLKQLKEKEYILTQQAKMIAMREMLESIAHQWRQPLSTISTAASGLKLQKEFNNLSDTQFYDSVDIIVNNTLNLSKTIDNFKNYFNTRNEKTYFSLQATLKKVLDLVGYRLNDHKIEVIVQTQNLYYEGLENELMETLINIINNAQEAFEHKKINKRYLFIDIYKEQKNICIMIKDNAGGMTQEVLEHVFEPYFTTKHKLHGTGLGLYMSYEVITKHFNGSIKINNYEFLYNKVNYNGIKVMIKLPIK